MRRVAMLFAVALVAPLGAQTSDCTPQPIEYLLWGEPGQAIVPVSTDTNNYVPEGEVWRIRAAGIATDDGQMLEWMLQIQHRLANGACCWLIPLHRQTGSAAGTPVLALSREVLLTSGERLSARVNGLGPTKKMALLYVGWRFPATCLPRLLGVEAGAVPVATDTQDLSALRAAAAAAESALRMLAASVPPPE